jgi:hypothetical protein
MILSAIPSRIVVDKSSIAVRIRSVGVDATVSRASRARSVVPSYTMNPSQVRYHQQTFWTVSTMNMTRMSPTTIECGFCLFCVFPADPINI